MKLTKRVICLLMALALTFALCACGEKEDNGDTNQTAPTTTTTTNSEGGNLGGEDIFNDGELSWD